MTTGLYCSLLAPPGTPSPPPSDIHPLLDYSNGAWVSKMCDERATSSRAAVPKPRLEISGAVPKKKSLANADKRPTTTQFFLRDLEATISAQEQPVRLQGHGKRVHTGQGTMVRTRGKCTAPRERRCSSSRRPARNLVAVAARAASRTAHRAPAWSRGHCPATADAPC